MSKRKIALQSFIEVFEVLIALPIGIMLALSYIAKKQK